MATHPMSVRLPAFLFPLVISACAPSAPEMVDGYSDFRFEIAISPELDTGPLDGRVLLLLSEADDPEPRFQRLRSSNPPQIFGGDVEALRPGESTMLDGGSRGYPAESLAGVPAGEYFVQAVYNVYTTFNRADGHTMKAHMDQWEGQQWNRSPGNLVSPVERVRVDPGSNDVVRVTLDQVIPPLDLPEDTEYVKHERLDNRLQAGVDNNYHRQPRQPENDAACSASTHN